VDALQSRQASGTAAFYASYVNDCSVS